MSVLIKGMEMPTEQYGKMVITLYPNGHVAEYIGDIGRVWEAVPVPPHGRLIEAEPIMKYITDGLNSGEFGYDQIKVLAELQYAPTIIEAEDTNKEAANDQNNS